MKKSQPAGRQGFSLIELLIAITIIGILSSIGLSTFTSAQIKSRDAKRKAHLKQLADSFEAYHNDYGQYPAEDGSGGLDGYTWGASEFSDAKGTVYMVQLPQDPTLGMSYIYDAGAPVAGKITTFQLYTRLENNLDPAINKDSNNQPLVFESLSCGSRDCNYGVSSSNTNPKNGRNLVQE